MSEREKSIYHNIALILLSLFLSYSFWKVRFGFINFNFYSIVVIIGLALSFYFILAIVYALGFSKGKDESK